jgi:DNA invertase Pin-like site-specific DNA recombinase
MKVAVYIRVLTEKQVKEGYSLEVQREYLGSFANRKQYKIKDCNIY